MTTAELLALNKGIDKRLDVGQQIVVKGERDANSPEILKQGTPEQALRNYNKYVTIPQKIRELYPNINDKNYEELKKHFKPSEENHIFYSRFNLLQAGDQQQVLNIIKYCKSQNITEPDKIKAEILKYNPELNLFNSGKSIPMYSAGDRTPQWQRKDNGTFVSLETFVKDFLGLNIQSGEGKKIYERLIQLPPEKLGKISASGFKTLAGDKSFDVIADVFSSNGVNLRTRDEVSAITNSPREVLRREAREKRQLVSQNVGIAIDSAINVLKNYQDNQGWLNVGFYREKLGQLLDKVNPTDIACCMDTVIKQLEEGKKYMQSRLAVAADNPREFSATFKEFTGMEYNEADMDAFFDLARNGGEEWTEAHDKAYNKAFGTKFLDWAVKKTDILSWTDGAADIVLMLLGTEAIGKGIGVGLEKTVGKKALMGINSTKAGRVAFSAGVGGTTLATWTAASGTVNNLTKTAETTAQDWEMLAEATVESFGFGAFAGVFNETVVSKLVSKLDKPAPRMTKAVVEGFEKNGSLTGKEVMQLATIAEKTPGLGVKTAAFLTEVAGFTGYETALDVVKDICDPESGNLPDDMTFENLVEYLGKTAWGQIKTLGEIKGISALLMMRKGGKVGQQIMQNQMLNNSEALKNLKFKPTTINGREFYEVTFPDGNRRVATSPEQAIAISQVAFQAEFLKGLVSEKQPENLTRKNTTEDLNFIAEKVDELRDSNLEQLEILNRMSPEERDDFTDALDYFGDTETFMLFASGLKPSCLLAASEVEFVDKLKTDDVDVVKRTLVFNDGTSVENAFVLNKNRVKNVISANKELYAKRMGLSENSSIDEIYNRLISEESPLKHEEGNQDIIGLTLGFPKINTLIFRLEQGIPYFDVQSRYYKDLTPYKNSLKEVLRGENSPYKNMSEEFKSNLEQQIDNIREIKNSSIELCGNNDAGRAGYYFISFVDEPAEIARIRGEIHSLAEKLKSASPITMKEKKVPQGLTNEEDAFLQRAKEENPAGVVGDKVKREWLRADVNTGVEETEQPLIVADKNGRARLELQKVEEAADEPLPSVNDEVTGLIIKGKLNETLTKRYDEMGKVLGEIISKNSAEIKKLASECKNDKQKFADGVVKILAKEFGLEGFEPPIEFVELGSADGSADWPNGKIEINKNIRNVKSLVGIISHEFVHMLQYRDVLAQYGEQGVREIIMNDKTIPAADKESTIAKVLNNPYNKHLLESYEFQKSETGSLNDYITRVYKEEFTNTATPENMEAYTNQATERGAYHLGSNSVENNFEQAGVFEEPVEFVTPKPRDLHSAKANLFKRLGVKPVGNNDAFKATNVTNNGEFYIDNDGVAHFKKKTPAGIAETHSDMTPEEYAARLKNMSKDEFITDVAKFCYQDATPMSKEELAEFKASDDAAKMYEAFTANKELFTALMEKEPNGRFRWGYENKYEKIFDFVNKVIDGDITDSKAIMAEFNSLKSIYEYIETAATGEKPEGVKFGLSPKKSSFLDRLIQDKRDELDDSYEVNRIVDSMLNIKNDTDVDYLLNLANKYDYTIEDASRVLRTLKTAEQRANFDEIAGLGLVSNDDAIIIAQVMELPGGKERVKEALNRDTKRSKIYGLRALADENLIKYSRDKLEKYRLLEYPQLFINDIEKFVNNNSALTALMERKLLEDKDLQDGEQIYRLASLTEDAFSVYEKLQSENGMSKEDACTVATMNYYVTDYYETLGLSDFKGLKTVQDFHELKEAFYYGYKMDNFKARSAELAKAEHLSGKDIGILCDIREEEWPRVLRRGLLENKNLNVEQIKSLAGISEELYARVLELDILGKIDAKDYPDTILKMPKAVCQRYFELKDKLPESVKSSLDFNELVSLAQIQPENVENVCKFLDLKCRRISRDQLGVNDINNLLYNFSGAIAKNPQVLDKMLEFADMKLLEEQGARQLNTREISDLMDLYIGTLNPATPEDVPMFEKTMELITNPKRNPKNPRISVSDAVSLSRFILNKAYDVESTQAERNSFVEDLIFIPERGANQLSGSFVLQLAKDFRTADRLAEYKEFLFCPARENAGAKQLNSEELSDMFVGFADQKVNLETYKKLLFVEERGVQQFNGNDIKNLGYLSAEQLAKLKKYYQVDENIGQFSGADLRNFADFDDAQFARLDKLLLLENSSNLKSSTLKAVCQKLDEVQFGNFMDLKNEFPHVDPNMLFSIAELKGQEHEQARKLFSMQKGLSSDQLVRIAQLEPANFQRAVGYLEAGRRSYIAEALARSNDVKIEEKYDKAISDAKAKRNQLKSGLKDLSDNDIEMFFMQNGPAIISTIDMLGLPTFTHSYTSKLTGVEKLANTVRTLQSRLSAEDFAHLKQNLAEKSIEPQDKIAKLQAIGSLREYLTEAELQEYIDLIKPNTPTKAETKLAKEIWANPKMRYDDKFALFCETFGIDPTNKKVIDFFEKRATVNAKGYKILNGIKENEVAKLLEIEVVKKRNLQEWNEAIDKKIFSTINIAYTPELSSKLHLTDNKYLEQVLSANDAFKDNFGELVDELVAHPEMSIRDAFNQMPHNLETRRQFEEFGIDYDKWVDADVNSYRSVQVSTNAEKTKQAAIENLEADFNDPAFKAIPEAETKKIFDALEQLGIKVVTKQEPQYDIDGFVTGYKDVSRFYENDAPVEFARLPKVISAIKKVMNENDFWTKSSNDTALNQNIETVYNHIMKLRDAEITNAAKLKDDEVTDIEVHKTDMNNVSHSLFLGNHGACCTAVGTGCNQYAAPRYSMDKCVSAIEVMDGKDFVGNSMCYFAKVDGELALVLDNIELNGKYQFNDKIRDTFMDYAKQLCEEVGKPDIAIYAGPYRHKLNMTPYETAKHDITIIGSTGGDATYIDFVTGRYVIDGQEVSSGINLFKIR